LIDPKRRFAKQIGDVVDGGGAGRGYGVCCRGAGRRIEVNSAVSDFSGSWLNSADSYFLDSKKEVHASAGTVGG